MDPLSTIARIMESHGSRCSVEEFHSAVNITFHQFESENYDEMHQEMWESLPRQFSLLAEDCLRDCPGLPDRIGVLDIGCGTGLASDSLLHSALRPRIGTIDLLDTSIAMLRRASERAMGWNIPVAQFEGVLDTLLPRNKQYDLIVTCSVLHHIPDLEAFLRTVRGLQKSGGVFLHLQDPNGDYLSDSELTKRMAEASERPLPQWLSRLSPRRVLGRVGRELRGTQNQDYLSKTNRALLESGIVSTPLTVEEIFEITDIHANHVMAGEGGISIDRMKSWLPEYSLLSQRSYGFFGRLWSTLSPRLQTIEEGLIERHALNGFHIGAVWALKDTP